MKISLHDFITKFCDMYQIITVIDVSIDGWCKFTDIRSMPVWEASTEEKFKDILEMSVSGIHIINGSQGIDAELCIDVKKEASHEGDSVPRKD